MASALAPAGPLHEVAVRHPTKRLARVMSTRPASCNDSGRTRWIASEFMADCNSRVLALCGWAARPSSLSLGDPFPQFCAQLYIQWLLWPKSVTFKSVQKFQRIVIKQPKYTSHIALGRRLGRLSVPHFAPLAQVEPIDSTASEPNLDLAHLVSNAVTEACREANLSIIGSEGDAPEERREPQSCAQLYMLYSIHDYGFLHVFTLVIHAVKLAVTLEGCLYLEQRPGVLSL